MCSWWDISSSGPGFLWLHHCCCHEDPFNPRANKDFQNLRLSSERSDSLLWFGSLLISRSSAGSSLDQDKVLSMFYRAVTPMLNPIIYSLRNKEIKDALKKTQGEKVEMSPLCLIVP